MDDACEQLLQFFDYAHLQDVQLRSASVVFHDLAHMLVGMLPHNDPLEHSLRKLIEAKDCAVRSVLS